MLALICIVVFGTIVGTTLWAGHRFYARPGRFYDRLKIRNQPASVLTGGGEADGAGSNLLERIGGMVPISPQDASLARRFLIGAGYRSERAVAVLYGAKVLSCL